MSETRADRPNAPATFPRDAVLTIEQVAAGLGVSTRTVERLDLPTWYLGRRTRRYLWGTVLDCLDHRSKAGAA